MSNHFCYTIVLIVLFVFDNEKDAVSTKKKRIADLAKDTIDFNDDVVVHPSGLKQYCIEILPGEGEVSLFVAALSKNDKSGEYAKEYEEGKREPPFLRA